MELSSMGDGELIVFAEAWEAVLGVDSEDSPAISAMLEATAKNPGDERHLLYLAQLYKSLADAPGDSYWWAAFSTALRSTQEHPRNPWAHSFFAIMLSEVSSQAIRDAFELHNARSFDLYLERQSEFLPRLTRAMEVHRELAMADQASGEAFLRNALQTIGMNAELSRIRAKLPRNQAINAEDVAHAILVGCNPALEIIAMPALCSDVATAFVENPLWIELQNQVDPGIVEYLGRRLAQMEPSSPLAERILAIAGDE
ncbi:MAG: hypothetical protein AAGA95_22365 [Pseudomonadota bacterium]